MESLLEQILVATDAKIQTRKEVNQLQLENKNLTNRLSTLSSNHQEERENLQGKIKRLDDSLQEKKRHITEQTNKWEVEKSGLENKLKQLESNLRKKEQSLKQLNDKAFMASSKGATVVNFDVKFGISGKPVASQFFYNQTSDARDLFAMNQQDRWHKLAQENDLYRDTLFQLHEKLKECITKRQPYLDALLRRPDLQSFQKIRTSILDLKNELTSLTHTDFQHIAIDALRHNFDSLTSMLDAIDSHKQVIPTGVSSMEMKDLDIEAITDIGRLQDIISKEVVKPRVLQVFCGISEPAHSGQNC